MMRSKVERERCDERMEKRKEGSGQAEKKRSDKLKEMREREKIVKKCSRNK